MLQLLLSGRGRLITHLTGWALVTLATYYLLSGMMPAREALFRTLVFIFFPLVLFYTNARVLTNRFFEAQQYGKWAVLAISLWLGMAYLRVKAELAIFGSTVFSNQEMPVDGGRNVFMVTVVIYFILMIFSGLYQLLENRRDLDARHAEAQLSYLKAQINPHFLFNTLNNIYAAATLQHPRTADMVLRLSDLLRYVTYDGQAQTVPLDKEIGQIRAYIELFQWKSEHPLPITLNIEGDTAGHPIEPLLLLPLVENALKHGDLESAPDAFLHISLQCSPQQLLFTVENSFDPDNQQKDEQGGVGLENVRQRLSLGYAGRHQLTVQSEGRIFKAQLRLNA
ncbi:MAG: sensor histidine kinase [Chitinophagales bacterium]|nr:sensor histidine kinase [Chitinophagales bacterium]